ncbi:uncharacterized protein ig2599ANME_1683 [groundwater metagenome]
MGEIMSSAGNIIKMLVGIVILIAGIVWYTGIPGYSGFGEQLLVLIQGSVGLFLLFVGLIVAWMGYDDYKMDKEMAKEEKKEEK